MITALLEAHGQGGSCEEGGERELLLVVVLLLAVLPAECQQGVHHSPSWSAGYVPPRRVRQAWHRCCSPALQAVGHTTTVFSLLTLSRLGWVMAP